MRRNNRCILLYKRLKDTASIDDLIPPIKHCRNHHSHVCQTPIARIDNWNGSLRPLKIGIRFQCDIFLSWRCRGWCITGPCKWMSFDMSPSVGNRTGKSQSIIGRVKPIDYRLYNRISHNWHQIINHSMHFIFLYYLKCNSIYCITKVI